MKENHNSSVRAHRIVTYEMASSSVWLALENGWSIGTSNCNLDDEHCIHTLQITFFARNSLQHRLSWWLLALIASIQYSLYLVVALIWFILCRILPYVYRRIYRAYMSLQEHFFKSSIGL